jgi:hypothetical protein
LFSLSLLIDKQIGKEKETPPNENMKQKNGNRLSHEKI